jgi:hypothetical protein
VYRHRKRRSSKNTWEQLTFGFYLYKRRVTDHRPQEPCPITFSVVPSICPNSALKCSTATSLKVLHNPSSSHCYCYVAGAQSDPCTATISDLMYYASPSEFLSFLIHPPTALWHLPAEISSSEEEETWRELAVYFFLRSVSYS